MLSLEYDGPALQEKGSGWSTGQRARCPRGRSTRLHLLAAAALFLSACGSGDQPPPPPQASNAQAPQPPSAPPGDAAAPGWSLQSSGEGVALALIPAEGAAAIRLFCPSGRSQLLVNVPAFRPIGSEERLSFGSGGEVVALVADTRGDAQRGGVSGTGSLPANLSALVGGPVSASYGAQTSGPHPAPPADLARGFVAACRGPAAEAAQSGSASSGEVSACLMQDGRRLSVTPLHAVGTEPFWAARIEGRCVTYSHPENQDGTRVWTQYAETPDGATWSGALDGRRFELRTRARPGCSDGMSDKRYPLAVELIVHGEQRRGCAEPA